MEFNFTTEEIIIHHKNDVLYNKRKREKNYPVIYLLRVARVDAKYIRGSGGYSSYTWPATFVLVSDVNSHALFRSLFSYFFAFFSDDLYPFLVCGLSSRAMPCTFCTRKQSIITATLIM